MKNKIKFKKINEADTWFSRNFGTGKSGEIAKARYGKDTFRNAVKVEDEINDVEDDGYGLVKKAAALILLNIPIVNVVAAYYLQLGINKIEKKIDIINDELTNVEDPREKKILSDKLLKLKQKELIDLKKLQEIRIKSKQELSEMDAQEKKEAISKSKEKIIKILKKEKNNEEKNNEK